MSSGLSQPRVPSARQPRRREPAHLKRLGRVHSHPDQCAARECELALGISRQQARHCPRGADEDHVALGEAFGLSPTPQPTPRDAVSTRPPILFAFSRRVAGLARRRFRRQKNSPASVAYAVSGDVTVLGAAHNAVGADWAGDDLEEVTVGILEIEAAPGTKLGNPHGAAALRRAGKGNSARRQGDQGQGRRLCEGAGAGGGGVAPGRRGEPWRHRPGSQRARHPHAAGEGVA
jgi:hypothetical protein